LTGTAWKNPAASWRSSWWIIWTRDQPSISAQCSKAGALAMQRGLDGFAAYHALQTQCFHQPRHGAAGHLMAPPQQLAPDLMHTTLRTPQMPSFSANKRSINGIRPASRLARTERLVWFTRRAACA